MIRMTTTAAIVANRALGSSRQCLFRFLPQGRQSSSILTTATPIRRTMATRTRIAARTNHNYFAATLSAASSGLSPSVVSSQHAAAAASSTSAINNNYNGHRLFSSEIRAQSAAVAAANASIAAEQAAASSSSSSSSTGAKPNPKKAAESNVFLDNLGKIFLLGIVAVIATLVRSTYNTSNRNLIRDQLEDIAQLDPKEIEEFREANSELTIDVMRKLISIYYKDRAADVAAKKNSLSSTSNFDGYGGEKGEKQKCSCASSSSYKEFVQTVRTIMATKFEDQGRGDSFTIQMGHYLDRIVVDVLEQRRGAGVENNNNGGFDDNNSNSNEDEDEVQLPVALFWTALVSAMNGPVSDRIRILHEIMMIEQQQQQQQQQQLEGEGSNKSSSDGTASTDAAAITDIVSLSSVRDMVGYLQETCQLPPDTQIVPTEQKYPAQQWRRATPDDLVPDTTTASDESSSDSNNDNDNNNTNANDDDPLGVDLVEFAAILRTKSVCAWGECYQKWKPDAREFENAPGVVDEHVNANVNVAVASN